MVGTPFATASRYGRTFGTVGDSFGPTLYVDTVRGNDSNGGTYPTAAFATMQAAFDALAALYAAGGGMAASNATIYVSGHITEQVETPADVFGVRIVGLVNGNPRNTTDSGTVLPGNGVDWVSPSSPTADEPLLRISEQGWEVHNILMVPANGIAAIELRREETATYFDASHAVFENIRFIAASTTGTIGIEDIGGSGFVTVRNCVFDTLASGIVNTSTAIANPLRWLVTGNRFLNNTEHIDMPFTESWYTWNIHDEATTNIDFSGGGGGNFVNNNNFDNDAANIAPGDGYTAGTGDSWQVNQANDAAYYGIPA